jgi:putative membrane-bound dehydrogenase-like protein|tara:strand:- start:1207 stop:4098 length:2892 start_codon:yes stop_codon:yes gene_type:complete
MKKMRLFLGWLACCAVLSANPLKDKGRPVAQTDALPAEETVTGFVLPDGFSANVVASEPDIVQPIAFTTDDRGRLWVLENTNYPNCPGEKKDRILILEDADGDGVAEKKTVFYDKMSFASGIAVGHGGVWIGAPPNLLFFPRKENEDVFTGEPRVVLDGWGGQDTHETLNSFIWGPDGWLYGTQGIFTHSKVGKPGVPDADRVGINAGIWRLHPKTEKFELYAEGGSNQWGLDFDDNGRGYFAACVISHMWEAVQGARYSRQAGSHFNQFTYNDVTTVATFAYEKRAYCGAMVYLGGQWPDEYRNNFFFGDIHMNRMRNEKFERHGSGLKNVKNGDFLVSKDPWYRGINLQYGPDGSVFIIDWYDRVPCHQQRKYTDRSNGRMYRIAHGKPESVKVDLQKASDAELVAYQLHENDWFVRRARRILAERGGNAEVHTGLKKILSENPDTSRKLRALWALHVTGGLDQALLLGLLSQDAEFVRAWAVQLAAEDGKLPGNIAGLAAGDESPVVRRFLASALGRLSPEDRGNSLLTLASRKEDANDPNIPQLLWYAAEPLVGADTGFAAELLTGSEIPMLNRNIARRVAVGADPGKLASLVAVLSEMESEGKALDVLTGINISLKGKKNLRAPEGWGGLYLRFVKLENKNLVEQVKSLAATFGGQEAIAEMRAIVASADTGVEDKKKALESLLRIGDPELHATLVSLVRTPNSLREIALRGLTSFPRDGNTKIILAAYVGFTNQEKTAALETLVSRRQGAMDLLKAVDGGTVPQRDLSAQLVRQISGLDDNAMNAWIEKNWGSVSKTSAEKEKEMAHFRKFLGEEAILNADASAGRILFNQRCAACHILHGEGAKIGPELPGNFKDVDYLLQNILDPNATIGKDYQQTTVEKSDGQFVSGVIVSDDAETVVLKTLSGNVSVPRKKVKELKTSELSLMPEGLMIGLEEPEIRDLFLYLRQSKQVPLPE